ncbi:MAG: FAD synthase [Candidatus Magasanikbacteria bacterium GW2011_GWC2_37_14]|uniref:FAD synthase n=1 Tax=Candidatus Magasanikbacteria bacterium GW2011_GWC2_37_14 TaxID=1619046 RepID=A0A0G0GPP0_9BACT|nr:MAG: FAD synthase [Candidatus Magasanikbacteria bacterium GW2011_GWC2_37_14]
MIFGTFDIVHAGHLHMFKEAKKYGDFLVVVVARDQNVEIIKGLGSLHSEEERLLFLENIKLIDQVLLGDKTDVYKVVNEIKPNIIALGYDQKIYVDNLEKAITNFGLNTRIVRLAPYQENRLKSNKIRKYIERLV